MTKIEFINTIAESCIKLYDKYKILPSLTIAQACKESKFGMDKALGQYHYNYFGMKWTKSSGCDYVEYNTKEFKNGEYIQVKAKFRSYKSFDEGIEGYYKFITGYKRYANLIGEENSYNACIKIADDGWATAPNYGKSLYNDYVVPYNLTKFDDVVLHGKKIENDEKEEIYIVKPNDTLWDISKKFLGSGIKWRKIAYANNLVGSLIKVGQELKIPKE